ncbi:MAC/perforin domain-containing protein [Bacteroides sp. GM023]|uniref:MAC/perforin domain-containing protein n=1 Tax=Bacteroides sp. GM023 TaxID=2723058 RepID=UPI00168BF410|nr:MAC/perforin domain-containing protein [Bacteroides sp. GM023]MBD3590790.1 hypothetical protein [Bacteroides sp. GM023]
MKNLLSFSLIILFVMSCSNEDEISDPTSLYDQDNTTSEIILKERDPNLPRVWSKKTTPRANTRASYTDATDFLGNSYAIENGTSIIGDFSNARFPIVNMKKLLERYPSYIVVKELRTTSTEAMSYASFERLETTSSYTKTIKSGFSLNIGPFKMGRTKTITDVFKHNTDNSQQAVHGELSVEVINGMISLQTAPSALKRISADYLDELFVDALYNSSMVELMQSYGEFVLTCYYTGGRASALYYGLDKKSTDFQSKERDMDTSINASYSWDKNSVSGDFTIGTKDGNSSTANEAFSELRVSIKTLGGAYGYNVATPPYDVKAASINLTSWLQSLNDSRTHTMIDIQDGGLYPISDFILEENFKQRYNDTHMEFQYQEVLEEPYIEIMKVYVRKSSSGEKLYDIVPVLSTRQGDKLIFSNPNATNQSDAELKANSIITTFTEKSNAIKDEKSKYYKLAIKANPNKVINPIIQTTLSFPIDNVNEAEMYKFKNPNTNIWYIYNPKSLYCFAYYDDDYILDAYGIYEWVNNIPVKSVSMTTLYQRYRIFGL